MAMRRNLLRERLDAAPAHADGQCAIRLAGRHSGPEERGAVLALEGDKVAAGIKHRNAQGTQLEFRCLGKGGLYDRVGGL